jgi:hypothetical protein
MDPDSELEKISEEIATEDRESSHEQKTIETIQNYFAVLLAAPFEKTSGDGYYRSIQGNLGSHPVQFLEKRSFGNRVVPLEPKKGFEGFGGYPPTSSIWYREALHEHNFPRIEVGIEQGKAKSISFFWSPQDKTFKGYRDPLYDNLPKGVKALMELGGTDSYGGVSFELGDLISGGDINGVTFYSSRERIISLNYLPKGTKKESGKFNSNEGIARLPWQFVTRNQSSEYVAELLKLLPIKPVDQLMAE